MIRVHHLEHSRSERIFWLLEELGLSYDIVRYKRDPHTSMAPPELRAIHPLGRSPIVTDGELVLAESGAIVEYFVDRYGADKLAPPRGADERLRYTYWLHAIEGSLAPPMVMDFLIGSAGDGVSAARAYIAGQYTAQLAFIEHELGRSSWLAGEQFSAADILMVRTLRRLHAKDTSVPHPHISAYLQRAQQRPAYLRAMTKAMQDV